MRKKLLILATVLAVLAALLTGMATFWTEYQWFAALGYSSVFVTTLVAKVATGVAFGLVALVVLGLHVVMIRRFSRPRGDWVITLPEGDLDLRDLISKVTTPVVVAIACAVAAAMGYWASLSWQDVLKALHATSFGRTEPILGKDIGFYLFYLPLAQFAQNWMVYLTGACAAFVAIIYTARGAIVVKGNWPTMSRQVRGHLLFALATVLLVIAWGFRLEMFETLFSKRGVAYGATYTDVYANLIAYRILIAACIAVAVYFLVAIRLHRNEARAIRFPAYVMLGLLGLYGIGVFAWPTVVQSLIVNPNELQRERPYLEHAIEGTRRAYGLDRIQVKEFPATEDLHLADLRKNAPTMDNIKIWDHRPLRETYRQLQVIRLYYDFPNISVDRYRIGDKVWQVMLSARELIHDQLQSPTWVNRHLQYTHGYGVCLSPVNHAIGEGLPDFWIKNIPPESRDPELRVERPEIYYGLESDSYELVRTTMQEFDYPRGNDNVYTTYQGKGGVAVGSFLQRLLFAIRFSDVNLFFTKVLEPESRILFNRSIQARVQTLAPFLMLDQEPYITVVDGRLKWIQDAYTISYRYPYSQPTHLGRGKRINYLRNSVKTVIDAYDGSVTFYVWDQHDPMIETYRAMFPALFRDGKEMPAALRAHVRYPKDLFTVQAAMYESFHMTDPRVFYNQEDKWSISRELEQKSRGGSTKREVPRPPPGVTAERITAQERMDPYYMIMRLPGEKDAEFLLMLPYTPSNKDNMVAWMTARCDLDDYGRLLVYTFPKKKLVFGPLQIEARIDQDDYISQWITLRNQQGSTVIRGDLLIIPIEQSILYVEPIYLQSTQTQLPELKQVIVSFGERVAMRPTLREALEEVFGGGAVPATASGIHVRRSNKVTQTTAATASNGASTSAPGAASPSSGETISATSEASRLAGEALAIYETAQKKLATGDWSGYGTEQQELHRKLRVLAETLQPQLQPSTVTKPSSAPMPGATPKKTQPPAAPKAP